jgi:hypothetical protein
MLDPLRIGFDEEDLVEAIRAILGNFLTLVSTNVYHASGTSVLDNDFQEMSNNRHMIVLFHVNAWLSRCKELTIFRGRKMGRLMVADDKSTVGCFLGQA